MDSLLPHVTAKLGDSNIRLHDSSKDVIVFCAEQTFYGLSFTLGQLRGLVFCKRGHTRAKQLSGTVDAVSKLVEIFPGKSSANDEDALDQQIQLWTMDDITPFIEAGLDDVV